jgi:ribonuclease D
MLAARRRTAGGAESEAIIGSAEPEPPIQSPSEVAEIAAAVRRAGRLYFDLEFVSDGRYVPELALIQVAWGDPDRPRVAAVDPLAVDPAPLIELVADPAVETVLHSGQADLSLLGTRFGVEGRAVVDTQIAAALLGLGDQLGYAALVELLTGVVLDKSHQFTDWKRRPLAAERIRYALDDVRYLPLLWRELAARLDRRGRRPWLEAESAALARSAVRRPEPDEAYRRVRGWDRLKPRALAALRGGAAWREREALATNTPPRWLIQDRPLLEAARRLPADEGGLAAVPGLGRGTVRQHGAALLSALERGAGEPPPAEASRPPPLTGRLKEWAAAVFATVQERCREEEVASRFVATRSDSEALVRWWRDRAGRAEGAALPEPDLPLLTGWRREVAGRAALAVLDGTTAAPDEG